MSGLRGPAPFLDPTWYAIWSFQAVLGGVIGLTAGRAWGRDASAGRLIAVVVAAWVGELLVVALLSPFLSVDLRLFHAPWVWLVATGGPIQPVAASAGALVGRALSRPPAARTTL